MAMVMMASPVALPANGHAFNGAQEMHILEMGHTEEQIGNGPHPEPCDDLHNQGTPTGGHGQQAAAAEVPNIFSSFKNIIFGPAAPDSTTHAANLEAYADGNAADANGAKAEHHGDQQVGPGAQERAANGHGDEDRREKIDLSQLHIRTGGEPLTEPGDGFPPGFAHLAAHAVTQDPTLNPTPNIATSATHAGVTVNNTATPSLPSTPRLDGPDAQPVLVQRSKAKGGAAPEATLETTPRSTVFQTVTEENQEHPHPPPPPQVAAAAPGHKEHGEGALYQQLARDHPAVPEHVNEGSRPRKPGSKDSSGCQLPECVLIRANAGASGIMAAGGAQMEYLLARVKQEKTASRARAWEESAKAKAFNRYSRDESKITAWENTMKAKAEARMRKAEEDLDKQRAKHVERMKNAVASAHRAAQEMRAAMEARRAEEIVKAEEIASRIRATGKMPRKCLCLTA